MELITFVIGKNFRMVRAKADNKKLNIKYQPMGKYIHQLIKGEVQDADDIKEKIKRQFNITDAFGSIVDTYQTDPDRGYRYEVSEIDDLFSPDKGVSQQVLTMENIFEYGDDMDNSTNA